MELNFTHEAGSWEVALPQAEALAQQALAFLQGEDSLSVVLADDAFIQRLNHDYRGFDKPTNVLSFPAAEGGEEGYLGDIILALETLQHEATEQGKSLEHHFIHLLIHGCLHLLGYDHEDENDAVEMETLEIQHLAKLGIANPYETR